VYRAHTVLAAGGDGIGIRPQNGATTTSAASRPAGNTTVDRFAVGCLARTTNSDFFPGRISEIIIYNRVLADSERGRLINALSKKYANEPVPVL
jgi:cytidine deaminase